MWLDTFTGMYVQDSEVVATVNHLMKLLSATTATVCDVVTDRLVTLPPWIRRHRHYAMFHRRRYLIRRIHTPPFRLNFRLLFSARCTIVQSAVLRLHVVCPSICPSVCDVGGSRPHSLEILETNCMDN